MSILLPPFRVNSRPPAFATVALLLALALALGHAALASLAMRNKSTTVDELAHLTGGYTFNHWNDFRLHPENGVLPQRWQALLLSLGPAPAFPPLAGLGWRESDVWQVGHEFLYEVGNDSARILRAGRMMNALFGAATVLLIFLWARRLWGPEGALVSATLATLSPTMLAHSGLATSDMAMAFFLLASVGAWWRHLHDGRTRWWIVSLAVFGGAFVAKFTAVLLPGMLGLLLLWRATRPEPFVLAGRTFASGPARLAGLTLSLAAHGAVAWAVVWAFFGFRYSAFHPDLPPGDFSLPWPTVLAFGGWKAHVLGWLREWRLLPEGWLYGLAFVFRHADARGAFLDGDYSIFGWVRFFPLAFFYKTSPALLVSVAAAGGFAILRSLPPTRARWVRWQQRLAPLLVLFVVYWAVSLASHLNIGHRHILPIYPVLFLACGLLGRAAVQSWRRSRRVGGLAAVLVAGLVAWQAATARGIYPHYLAYFSPLVGGPSEGYRHLVDSSLDWGQDLPGLQQWLKTGRRPGEPLFLSYFGSGEPDSYGIAATRMAMLPDFGRPHPWFWFEPGLYALSASMLQHVYMPDRGPWTPEQEQHYQHLRAFEASFRKLQASPDGSPELMRDASPLEWSQAWKRFEQLRFARLCHYLRVRRPEAMIGYSILIYRLDRSELDAALQGPASVLAAAIAREAGRSGP